MAKGEFMPKKLKRNVDIKIRLTEEERELVAKKMTAAKIRNREAYLRKMVLDGYIICLDLAELREALRLLANATNNINQIAKHVNEARQANTMDIQDLQVEVGHMRSQISVFLKTLAKLKQTAK